MLIVPQEVLQDDKMVLYFVIVVHLSSVAQSQPPHSSTQGWVISRTLEDFYTLHDKVVQVSGTG